MRNPKMKLLSVLFPVIALAGTVTFGWPSRAGAAAVAATRYYVYLFAFDDLKMTPDKTHTWATFVAFTPASDKSAAKIEQHTISWLPVSGVITTLTFGPERGRNYTLKESFDWAVREELKLGDWGPYETTKDFFDRSKRFHERLSSGEFWYRVLDTPNRVFKVLDPTSVRGPAAVMCSHAVADVVYDGDPRGFLLTGRASGFKATAEVAWHFTDWYVRNPSDPGYLNAVGDNTKLAMDEALGLSAYPDRKHFRLEQQNNHYCRTLEECRDSASLIDLQ